MQSEHAHLDRNIAVVHAPRASLEPHIEAIATKALEKIPGALEAVQKTFNKGRWEMPYTLPGKRHMNQKLHLGW